MPRVVLGDFLYIIEFNPQINLPEWALFISLLSALHLRKFFFFFFERKINSQR